VLGLIDARHQERRHTREFSGVRARPIAAVPARAQAGPAPTNFIRAVICWVFFTSGLRRRKSEKCGHRYSLSAHPHFAAAALGSSESFLERIDGGLDLALDGARQRLLRPIFFRIEG